MTADQQDRLDARTLRDAATVLLRRAKRQTLPLRIIVRCLERAANHIEKTPLVP